MEKTENIIVDLDGTVALERHRRHHILNGWEDYFAHIHLDPVNKSVLEFLHGFKHSHYIHIFTSRPVKYKDVTLAWLRKHNVPFWSMEMRAEADTHLGDDDWQTLKSDEDVKLEMLARHRIGPANTMCVLEDRDQMVDFYRRLGYDCWQVHPQHETYRPDVKAHPGVQNV